MDAGRARHVCAPAPGIGPEHDPHAAASAHAAFGLSRGDARAIFDEVVAGMRRVGEVLDARGVSARDRETIRPLLRACLSPPAWA